MTPANILPKANPRKAVVSVCVVTASLLAACGSKQEADLAAALNVSREATTLFEEFKIASQQDSYKTQVQNLTKGSGTQLLAGFIFQGLATAEAQDRLRATPRGLMTVGFFDTFHTNLAQFIEANGVAAAPTEADFTEYLTFTSLFLENPEFQAFFNAAHLNISAEDRANIVKTALFAMLLPNGGKLEQEALGSSPTASVAGRAGVGGIAALLLDTMEGSNGLGLDDPMSGNYSSSVTNFSSGVDYTISSGQVKIPSGADSADYIAASEGTYYDKSCGSGGQPVCDSPIGAQVCVHCNGHSVKTFVGTSCPKNNAGNVGKEYNPCNTGSGANQNPTPNTDMSQHLFYNSCGFSDSDNYQNRNHKNTMVSLNLGWDGCG